MANRLFTTPGPYHLSTVVNGREYNEFSIADTVPTSVSIIGTESGEFIHTLQGKFAARLALLLRDYPPDSSPFSAGRFNCFCMAELLLGNRQSYRWLEWMRERGERLEARMALEKLGLPLLFQICGQHLISAEPEKIAPLHEGFIVGLDHEVPVVVEKVAHDPLHTAQWDRVMQRWAEEPTVRVSHINWQSIKQLC